MSKPHTRHLLSGSKRVLNTGYAVCDVIFLAVILTCVHSYNERLVFGCNLDYLFKGWLERYYVIDLFTNEITSCNIWIKSSSFQDFKVLLEIVGGCYSIFDDSKWDPSDGSKESYHDTCLLIDLGHDLMDLS